MAPVKSLLLARVEVLPDCQRTTNEISLCGCVVVWLCGCVVVWLPGCLVAWLCGCISA